MDGDGNECTCFAGCINVVEWTLALCRIDAHRE